MNLSNRKNRIIFFFITWFGGMFGIHWFVQKNYMKGCLYLFTCGGFVFCWIYDVFKAFVNIFKDNSLFITNEKEKIINEDSNKNISGYYQQISACAEQHYIEEGIDYISLPDKSHILADVIMLYSFKNNPHEISININDYPQYYVYHYNVNPIKLCQRLLINGYLSYEIDCDNIVEFISSLKIPELKLLLKNVQQKTSGKKIELVNRILENYSIEQLEVIYPNIRDFCFLTPLGKEMIKVNEDLIELHRNYSRFMIEYDEYINAKNESKLSNFYKICINIFKKQEKNHYKEKNMWGQLRGTYFNMFSSYKKLNDMDNACRYLVKAIYIDLSGMHNNNLLINLNNSSLCLSKFLISVKDYYNDYYLDECLDIPLPFTFFNIETLKLIFHDILNGCADIKKYRITSIPKIDQKKYTYFKH